LQCGRVTSARVVALV